MILKAANWASYILVVTYGLHEIVGLQIGIPLKNHGREEDRLIVAAFVTRFIPLRLIRRQQCTFSASIGQKKVNTSLRCRNRHPTSTAL